MKKVIIIGGGIAGLSAGIYALQNGFDVELFEKNPHVGGECTGWMRKGYAVDNCIHFLTGCRKDDEIYSLWKNIGALDDHMKLYFSDYFYMADFKTVKLHFWSDLEKARKEFLAIAPEDKYEIDTFFDAVRKAEVIKIPAKKSMAELSIFERIKLGLSMSNMQTVFKEYGKQNVDELSQRFQNSYVRTAMKNYFDKDFPAVSFITSYAFYTGKTAAVPQGGSLAMTERIYRRFVELGGNVSTGKDVKKIQIENKTAVGIEMKDGEVVIADSIICAVDPDITFSKLLPFKYMPKKLRKIYDGSYVISSCYTIAFGISGNEDYDVPTESCIFPCEEFQIASRKVNVLGTRFFDYDKEVFPMDKRVLQCSIIQNEDDYQYWTDLYEDRSEYQKVKNTLARIIEQRIVSQYPKLDGKLIFLSDYSPVTFNRWCGAYKGAYMALLSKGGLKRRFEKFVFKKFHSRAG